MGSSASRPEGSEGEAPPAATQLIRRRIEEMKQRRRRDLRRRKDSILSTTDLLDHPVDPSEFSEDSVDRSASPPVAESDGSTGLKNEINEEEEKKQEKEDEKEILVEKRGEDKKAILVEKRGEEEEELQGSPSFRFYFLPSDLDDDGSVKSSWLNNIIEENTGEGAKEKENLHASEDPKGNSQHSRGNSNQSEDSAESLISNEESVAKSTKKMKGRKLRRITTVPSRVYKLLKIRDCYSHINASDAAVAAASRQHRRVSSRDAE